ncbi:Uncharacterised protein [Segatella copri]|nr:Uncharacterised protein [Segatella copri]
MAGRIELLLLIKSAQKFAIILRNIACIWMDELLQQTVEWCLLKRIAQCNIIC